MARLMSVSHTTEAVRSRTKTVTRRLGWWEDKRGRRLLSPGDRLTLCEKVMGRTHRCAACNGMGAVSLTPEDYPEELCLDELDLEDIECFDCRGTGSVTEPLVRLADVEVVAVKRMPLDWITEADVVAEGFPTASPLWFIDFFCEAFGVQPDDFVTRIEWRYLGDGES